VLARVVDSAEWKFFAVLPRVSAPMAVAWWAMVLLRGALPAAFAITMGVLVARVQEGASLGLPLILLGAVFIAMQTVTPIHLAVSTNLGSRTASWLNNRLMVATNAAPGMAHLERPELINDLTMARDFDLGITGPPLNISMDFIAVGLVQLASGTAAAIVLAGFAWWAPILLCAAWLSTHFLLRESTVWRDRNTDEVLEAQRHADYAYRLAVDAPAAKELRLFGIAGWTIDRFVGRRRRLFDLQWKATRMRERSLVWCVLIVVACNAIVFWALAHDAANGAVGLGAAIVFAQTAVGTSALAVGGFSWALSEAAQPVAVVMRLEESMAPAGALQNGSRPAAGLPASEIRFRNLHFAYLDGLPPVFDGFDLTIPAGTSMAIVGQNGAGKTTLAKLLCRLYDPQQGAIEVDGVDLREFDIDGWRARVAAVFQDFVKYELTLRENVAPLGAPDDIIRRAVEEAGAGGLAELDTVLSRASADGTDLSGGQWQRIALARALCAIELGAGVVLLDEPTAQLDVRGEAEIFDRILAATRSCTTILISHRFSTVRHADRIAVVEGGRLVELGTHDELMTLGGRYHTMFEMQASRFGEPEFEDGEEVVYDTLG
jgi:ABC-type multidrug transport system fused ATPase/permease subunit